MLSGSFLGVIYGISSQKKYMINLIISLTTNIISDCCDCSTKKPKESIRIHSSIEEGGEKNIINSKDEIEDDNILLDETNENINYNKSVTSEILNNVNIESNKGNNDEKNPTINELKKETPLNGKPIDKSENISWDEYDKKIEKLEKNKIKEKINDNPCTNMLPLYCIDERHKANAIALFEIKSNGYQVFLKNNITDDNTKANLREHVLLCDAKMSEDINALDYNVALAKKINAKVNKKANPTSIKVSRCKNDNSIVITDRDAVDLLSKGDLKLRLKDAEIYKKIQECLYAILSNNRITKCNMNFIKEILDPRFGVTDNKKNDKNKQKLSISERDEVIKAFHEICKFHNRMFIVLVDKKEINKIIKTNYNIKEAFKAVSDVLIKLYPRIIRTLNDNTES